MLQRKEEHASRLRAALAERHDAHMNSSELQTVEAREHHRLGGEGEAQKQVTPGEVTRSFLTCFKAPTAAVSELLHCPPLPTCASSGMVKNVSAANSLCTDNSQQFFQRFWSAFLPTSKADRILL